MNLGHGDGTFTAGTPVSVPIGDSFLAVADFNGDGKPDVLEQGTGTLLVLLGNGDAACPASARIDASRLYADVAWLRVVLASESKTRAYSPPSCHGARAGRICVLRWQWERGRLASHHAGNTGGHLCGDHHGHRRKRKSHDGTAGGCAVVSTRIGWL